MSRYTEQKIRLLLLFEILQRETDDKHALTTNEIREKLKTYGIEATRQTVYDDIEMLNSFGYEIITVHGRNNRYFIGDRTFELPEVQVLLHAVGAAKFLTEKKASVLAEKVAELLGEAQADSLKELLTVKSNELGNERVYYSIDAITTALIEKRKLSFLYFDYDGRGNRVYRKEGERYEVNPLGMVYSGENFYLVCFHDKYDNPASYRIDKMEDAQVEESKIIKKKGFENFDLNAYKRETFGMYYGEKKQVAVYFPSELLDVARDRFGAVEPKKEGDGYIVNVTVRISRTFFAWVAMFEGKVKILEPGTIKEQYKTFIERIYQSLD
mgnify:FL=1